MNQVSYDKNETLMLHSYRRRLTNYLDDEKIHSEPSFWLLHAKGHKVSCPAPYEVFPRLYSVAVYGALRRNQYGREGRTGKKRGRSVFIFRE